MSSEKIFFEKVKIHRDWYFVEYSPPIESFPFATVDLTILNSVEKTKVVEAMEYESKIWLARYPIPVMVSAFDDKESLIHLDPVRDCNYLMGYLPKAQHPPIFHWRSLNEEELSNDALDRNFLKKIYHDIPFRTWTSEDVKRVETENSKMVWTAWLILFVWLVAIPLTVIILGETSVWIAKMVLAYSLWRVFVQVMKLLGKWKKSPREIEQEREKLEMEHHHYHCKKNHWDFFV